MLGFGIPVSVGKAFQNVPVGLEHDRKFLS